MSYVPPVNGGCLPGWYQLEDSCLQSVGLQDADRKEYLDADVFCRQEGGGRGKLFQVTNQLEQSLLALLLQDYVGVTNLWIGLSDSNEEGQFVWSDGEPLGFSQWAPNQPNGFTDVPNEPFRDCVEVRTDPKYLGEWDDINCLERRGFICQTPLYKDLNSTNVVVPQECDGQPGYSQFKDGCYKLVSQTLSFNDAQDYCINEGAWLSTVRDGFYNSLLSLLVNWFKPTPEYVWIGLTQDNTNVYGWERPNPNEDRWPLTYAKWEKQYPKGNTCGALHRNSTWVDMECDTLNMFVCEYTETTVTINPEVTHCADGWTFIGGHCYKFDTLTGQYPQIHFTYSDAQTECTLRYNATLPGIHGYRANIDFSRQAAFYLGDRNIWLGLYQSVEGYYAYQDGRIIDYVNWASDAVDTTSDCISLSTETGEWQHEGCFKWGGLVCENDPLPGPPIPCEDGWSYFSEDSCYYVSDAADDTSWLSWEEAEQWCNDNKAHLTTLKNDGERDFVQNLIAPDKESFWMGLYRVTSPGDWFWSDGTAFDTGDSNPWSPDDETNWNGMEYCVLINENAQWEDHNCGIRRPYICKWDTSQTEPIVPTKEPPMGECAKGTYRLKDRCYDLSSMDEPMTWMDAHKECRNRVGEVAAIHSQGVQALLSFALKTVQNNVWIGLNRYGEFDQYHWADGSALDFTNWALGEPNSPYQQQDDENRIDSCVLMVNNPTYAGRWSDVDCETEHGFVCEMRLDVKHEEQPFPYTPCPNKPNYHSDGVSCFRILTHNTTFSNAQGDCEEDGAYLASVGDAYEEAFIEMFMSYFGVDMVWIGMQREAMEQFEWLDGWPVQYTSWASGYPTGSGNLNRCVLMTHQGWKNVNCYDAYPLVCKTTTAPKPPPPNPPSGLCRSGWFEFKSECYFFDDQNTEVSYAEALVLCQNRGASVLMASSTDSEVNTFLQTTARSVLEVNNVWLGLIYQNEEFQWIDGSLFVYTNWASDQPTTPVGADICVQMVTEGGGLWRNVDCFGKAGYICQAPLVEATLAVPTTSKAPPTPKVEPQGGLSIEAVIGISVGCGGVLMIILLAATCYFTEKSHMKKKMYAKQREASYRREI
ncbi:macrophage mannose receptor 1-like [Patiria miniata]|uniref:C-type lectin domain-containing protein n=1 Tax=Patiria miniata TaxID=46514 RepID=A0A914BQE5_PATMI|nr:macrophage mannose receptor 1-like [Patiria miniata]